LEWLVRRAETWLLLEEGLEAHNQMPLGFGFRHRVEGWCRLGVWIWPEARGRGLSRLLMEPLLEAEDPFLMAFHPAQERAMSFAQHHGFKQRALCFQQRWDGSPDEVPPAFQNVTLDLQPDPQQLASLLRRAHGESWPPLGVEMELLLSTGSLRCIAKDQGQALGALLAFPWQEEWQLSGLAVLPEARGQGIGRALLTALMRRAAEEGRGVILQVDQSAEETLRWTQSLGFWTFRSQIHCIRE